MKAILIPHPGRFEVTTVDDPHCRADEVVVRTAYCGLCGTDLEILRGSMPEGFARYPVVPGHEWTGVIEEVGKNVKDRREGERVSVEGYLPCGKCARCRDGSNNLCVTHEQIGMTQNGGLAEFVTAPARSCHLVADHVGLDEALMVEPASTVVRGIERAHPAAGCRAAVIGCGPIGLIAARVISRYAPSLLLGIDLATAQAPMATLAGFMHFTGSQDPKELRDRSGSDGWDLVVDCASNAKPLGLAFQIVRAGGTVVVIGSAPDSQQLQIPANLFVTRDLHVEGLLGYTTQSWIHTLELVAAGSLRLGDLITHRVPLAEFGRALKLVESRHEPTGKVAISFYE
jgi:L-iditol 2-dehydrogenase